MTAIQIETKELTSKELKHHKNLWLLNKNLSANPFLSSKWVTTALAQNNGKVQLVTATIDKKIVAFGVFVNKKEKVIGLIPKHTWYLHRTGERNLDQIWIEHNDFILSYNAPNEIRFKLIEHIFSDKTNQCDEIILGCTTLKPEQLVNTSKLLYETIWCAPSYITKIQPLGKYLSTQVSKNTRKQISRSIKLYGTSLSVVELAPSQVANKWHEFTNLHRKRWYPTKAQQGFDNPYFENFHRTLINDENSGAKVFYISYDKGTIGYIYLLFSQETAFFYLSSFTQVPDNRLKPGLVCHSVVIDYLSKNYESIRFYDFLAGDSRYKSSLASLNDYQTIWSIKRSNLFNRSVLKLKKIKAFLKNQLGN